LFVDGVEGHAHECITPEQGIGERMRVLRIAWLGVPVRDPSAMLRFFRDTLRMHVEFEEAGTVELSLPNDDRIQLFAPTHQTFSFLEANARGPVPLFEVDDLDAAAREIAASDAAVIGEAQHDENWTWINVRGPDGNLYMFAQRR
jgi:predicted enzyme related to lactoylglutathione lyase